MKRALFVILSMLAALILQASPSQAYHSDGAHWPGGPERGFVMVSDRSGGTVGNVDAAIAKWRAAGAYNIINVGPVCPNKYDPHYCLTLYSSDQVPPNSGDATTHIFGGNHILAADIRINPRGFANQAALDAVLVHEMGHGLGLFHRTDRGVSVMKSPVHQTFFPDWHDMEELRKNRH